MTWTKFLIGLFVLGWLVFTWALCLAAKHGDEMAADFAKLDDFTRWESEVRP